MPAPLGASDENTRREGRRPCQTQDRPSQEGSLSPRGMIRSVVGVVARKVLGVIPPAIGRGGNVPKIHLAASEAIAGRLASR